MDEPRLVKRVESVHTVTVDELVTWCFSRGLEPAEVTISAAHLKWTSPETTAERERRQLYEGHAAERNEKWERATLARLQAKYGDAG